MINRIVSLAGIIAFGALANFASAETIKVKPGSLGQKVISNEAKKGDKLVVNFEAAEGYILVDANCLDANKLGWTRSGPFSFELILEKDYDASVYHKTDFNGHVKAKPKAGKGGSGGSSEDELLPWDMTGLFKVLGEHEGVGDDLSRDPEAGLQTSKPGNAHEYVGVATYDEVNDKYVGAFKSNDPKHPDPFVGLYHSTPASLDLDTIKPFALGDPEQKNCPDAGCNEKVLYAYYGCTKGEKGFGGMADPDKISINTFTVQPELGNLEAQIKELEATIATKNTELETAKKEIKRITGLIADIEAKIAAAIAEKIKFIIRGAERQLEDAQEAVGNAEKALAEAKARLEQERIEKSEELVKLQNQLRQKRNQLATAEQDLANATKKSDNSRLERLIKSLKKDITGLEKDITREEESIESKLKTYVNKVTKAEADLKTAQDLLAQSEKKLTEVKATAEADARKDPKIAKMIQEQDALKAQLKEKEALAKKLTKEIEEAELKYGEAELRADVLRARQKFWDDDQPRILDHEKEHRVICYFYADKITALGNKLRAWGYSPNEIRAKNIGKQHFAKVYQEKIVAIQEEDIAKQTRFDDLTNHGIEPDEWNREQELR